MISTQIHESTTGRQKSLRFLILVFFNHQDKRYETLMTRGRYLDPDEITAMFEKKFSQKQENGLELIGVIHLHQGFTPHLVSNTKYRQIVEDICLRNFLRGLAGNEPKIKFTILGMMATLMNDTSIEQLYRDCYALGQATTDKRPPKERSMAWDYLIIGTVISIEVIRNMKNWILGQRLG